MASVWCSAQQIDMHRQGSRALVPNAHARGALALVGIGVGAFLDFTAGRVLRSRRRIFGRRPLNGLAVGGAD
jgi:hypothetical protein